MEFNFKKQLNFTSQIFSTKHFIYTSLEVLSHFFSTTIICISLQVPRHTNSFRADLPQRLAHHWYEQASAE